MIDLSSNIKDVLSFTDKFSKQYRFAVAVALTQTAREISKAMPAALDAALDKPTPFTKAGFFVLPATKDTLTAVVGVKDKQAEYLKYQINGGLRQPKKLTLRLPNDVQLNAFGNLPAGLIKQLVQRAQKGKRATKTQAKRFGVSQAADLFYGDPSDGRPAGIYKRVNAGTKQRLVPVIVFPKQAASYERRFDFEGAARKVTLATFGPTLRRAWARAVETAR